MEAEAVRPAPATVGVAAAPSAAPVTGRRARRGLSRPAVVVLRTVSLLLFFVLWWGVSLLNAHVLKVFNPILLPAPDEVLRAGIKMAASGELLKHITASLSRVVWGFGIAAALGIVVGTALGRSRLLEHLVEPMLEMLRPIPPLAFLPMMVLWFGIGEASKVAFITYAAFFPIFTTTIEGIKYVDPVLIRAASSLGASERQIFWHVVLPAATPNIITGHAPRLRVVLLRDRGRRVHRRRLGPGFLINDARTFFLVSNMLLGAAVIGIIGVLANVLLRKLEGRLLRWRKESRGQA
jgi:ABC-type nitrate/sulfonate/bicarbonate transport system, permease component